MNDRPTPDSPSGSRWEPGAGEQPDPGPAHPVASGDGPRTDATQEQAAAGPEAPAPGPATDPEQAPQKVANGRSRWLTLPVAGAAAAGLVTVSGLGGFAIGHAVGDDDRRPVSDSWGADGQWQPGERPGRGGPWGDGAHPHERPDHDSDLDDDTDDDTDSDSDDDGTDADTTADTGTTAGGQPA